MSVGFESEEYDFPAASPRLFYVICSAPRCGSTWLGTLLWRTGLAGAPDEYFNYYNVMLHYVRRLPGRNLADYTRELVSRRTGPNGVFGMKCHFDHFQFMRRLPTVAAQLRPLRYIRMERTDEVAQAVSASFAAASGQSRATWKPRAEPIYDRSDIERRLTVARRIGAQWEQFFTAAGAQPHRVRYEDLVAAPAAAIDGALQFLGVAGQQVPAFTPPELERQTDPRKEEWIARFKAERGI